MTALHKTKWFLPLLSVALGLLFFAALWAGGEHRAAVESFAILSGLGLVFLLGGRSDLIRGLRGDGRDEYWQRIDVRATALAGNVLIVAIIGMCAWEWGHGRDGSPYAQLGAIAGLAYVAAIGFLRWRS
jgi:hypothetical protein